MNFHDNVKRVIWRRMEHAVESETRVVDDVVQFAIFPEIFGAQSMLRGKVKIQTHLIVASSILCGKSSAETSPPTAIASPPAALISSTTASAFFTSKLRNHKQVDVAGEL